jgi:hypothetical protein
MDWLLVGITIVATVISTIASALQIHIWIEEHRNKKK